MSHPDYSRVEKHITAEAVKTTLMEMVDIASPTGREGALAQYIVDRLAKAGFNAYLQEVSEGRPNAVGVRPGTGDGVNLLFTGHMDTSYDGDEDYLRGEGFKAKAVYRDGWIWGLGANNMKSGLASALVAMEAICRENVQLKGDLLYGGVVGETEKAAVDEYRGSAVSGYGVGTRHMVLHGISADFSILCEPTNLRVCTANMGVLWVKITVGGTVSHAANSRHPSVINAIAEMHVLQVKLEEWIKGYEAAYVYLGEHPNVTVAAIRGGMPWRLPEDLKFFKAVTMGKPMIMGRKTYESIGRPLPGRANIVVTRTGEVNGEGITVTHDFHEAVKLARAIAAGNETDEIMVIGGGNIYEQALPLADRIYLTEIHADFDGDTFLPVLGDQWREVSRTPGTPPGGGPTYDVVVLERG